MKGQPDKLIRSFSGIYAYIMQVYMLTILFTASNRDENEGE